MAAQGADLVLASDTHGETQVLALDGFHAEAARSEGGLASLITRVPEQDTVVPTTDIKIVLADVHTACNVRDLCSLF